MVSVSAVASARAVLRCRTASYISMNSRSLRKAENAPEWVVTTRLLLRSVCSWVVAMAWQLSH